VTVTAASGLTGGSTSAGSSYATASRTPGSGLLQLIAVGNDVASGTAGTPTVVGCNLTWTQVRTQLSPNSRWRTTVFRAKGVAPTSGALTISFGGATQRSCRWVLTEHDGMVSLASEAMVQSVGSSGTDDTAEATLAAFDNAANATYFAAHSQNTGTGSTEGAPLALVTQTSNTWGRLRVGFYDGPDTTPDVTFAGAGEWAAIAIEVKALDQDPTGDPPSPWELTFNVTGTTVDEPPLPDPVTPSADTQSGLVVKIRDGDLVPAGEASDLLAFEYVDWAQAVGAWALTLPATSGNATLLLDDGAGIIVLRDGVPIFSGPVHRKTQRLSNGVTTLQVSGPSDLAALLLAWPEPTTEGPPFVTDAYDVRTGPAETLMYAYVSANVGPDSIVSRQNPLVELAVDQARGASITYSARWKNPVEVLADLSAASGLDFGFSVLQIERKLVFTVRQPADRSGVAKFSAELGNLRGYVYDEVAPEATVVIVAGQGEGTARTVVVAEDSAGIDRWGRSEKFVDRRDVPTEAELDVAASAALAEAGQRTSLTIEPIDTERLRYGREYLLGDKVAVVVGDAEIVQVVRGVRVQLGPQGEVVTPLVGSDPIPLDPTVAIYRRLDRQQAQLDRLNRR